MNIRRIKKQANKQTKTKRKGKKEQCRLRKVIKTQQNKKIGPTEY